MSDDALRKKWNHTTSPLGKLRDVLEDKRKEGTITLSEKIKLNELTMDFFKDMIKANKGDAEFAEMMIVEIKKIEKKNRKIAEEIKKNEERLARRKEEKPRVKHLRKGPKK